MFGEFCDQPCNCDAACDDVTGECHGSCLPGWMGHSCQINVVTFSLSFIFVLAILATFFTVTGFVVRRHGWANDRISNTCMYLDFDESTEVMHVEQEARLSSTEMEYDDLLDSSPAEHHTDFPSPGSLMSCEDTGTGPRATFDGISTRSDSRSHPTDDSASGYELPCVSYVVPPTLPRPPTCGPYQCLQNASANTMKGVTCVHDVKIIKS